MSKLGLPGVAGMLVAPAVKENSGSCHCSSHGLLAYGAGSSIVIVDVRSMQLVTVLPMPSPGTTAFQPAPFVTSVQWTPEGLQRDLTQESPTAHLRLAVGDKQGRIAIWNVGTGEISTWLGLEGERGKLGIQDMCWVYGQPWSLIAIHGSSLISLWDTNTGRSIWRLDGTPEVLGCVKCDPFDARQVCVIGSKGLVLSLHIAGMSELDVIVKRHQLNVAEERGNSAVPASGKGSGGAGDRDSGKDGGSVTGAGSSAVVNQISASLVGNNIKCLFSTTNRGILYIMFPREFFVFDLHFGTMLSNAGLPRGCGKLLELVAVDGDVLYCAHTDGRLTAWRKKGNQQVYSLCYTDVLLPALGTSVPAPTVLFVVNCSFQILFKSSGSNTWDPSTSSIDLLASSEPGSVPLVAATTQGARKNSLAPSKLKDEINAFCETRILSLSDDGRLWHWSVLSGCVNDCSLQSTHLKATIESLKSGESRGGDMGSQEMLPAKLDSNSSTPTFKLMLTGQLSLLPSSITTLAVPVPSMLATAPGGGNGPAVSVPLVALATQGGSIELVDAMSNSIASSFLVHSSSVRGLRWLGNSRLVSFSYTEIKGKGGGFVNVLTVTCVRSGQSKPFRTLQKPERAPVRALRTSPSGRYLLILFREAPAEVWAMTKNPQMLRSLALPFTAMEWALPPAPKLNTSLQTSSSSWRTSLFYKDRPTIASTIAAANAPSPVPVRVSEPGSGKNTEASQEDLAESFAFALVNGSLGVFEMHGRRVRDFRPKWPSASFVSADVLVTAMAYRTPHVVMGDRSGNIRWWDVTSGLSSTFNSHRGGVRRIKFAPVIVGDQTRGRVAVLFNDHTFAIYDLNTQDPLKNAIVQSQLGGVLVLELDWFPLRLDESESPLLCIAGADSSFRLLEVNTSSGSKSVPGSQRKAATWERFRPMPLCSPALLPLPHALALRMLLQLGVQPSWFSDHFSQVSKMTPEKVDVDLRNYMLETSLPILGEVVVAELLLKTLEPYRKAGQLLDLERACTYAALATKSCTLRCAFAAAHFGDYAEAAFWLQLPHSLSLLCKGSSGPSAFWENTKAISSKASTPTARKPGMEAALVSARDENELFLNSSIPTCSATQNQSDLSLPVPNNQVSVCAAARERILWHEKLQGPEAVQKRVHELVSIGDFEAAVTLLLSSSPDSTNFYVDALRAVSLASAVSPALHELAVKVVAANLVATENSLSGTHLLCAVGCYQEACTQLQDTGRWVDAATLAATHLQGTDYSRVLQRWADYVLHNEKNLWRAMILYVAAGALADALAALRDSKQPDSAAMFLSACHEFKSLAESQSSEAFGQGATANNHIEVSEANWLNLPGDLNHKEEEMRAVCEFYGQYQIALAHSCTGVAPVFY